MTEAESSAKKGSLLLIQAQLWSILTDSFNLTTDTQRTQSPFVLQCF